MTAGGSLEFESYAISEKGGRAENQDYVGSARASDWTCWVLADGLGGHQGGSTAARIAVDAALQAFASSPGSSPDSVRVYLEAADAAICEGQRDGHGPRGMRSTAVVLIAGRGQAVWGHLGDSRLYYFQSGRLAAQTSDHSVPQALAAAGEITPAEIRFHEDRGRLLRSLGTGQPLRPTSLDAVRPLSAGDAFLLCTDGFWEHVDEPRMERGLGEAASARDWLESLRREVEAASPADNYSALAIFAMR
jgi:serine/threonine protein phosphatase PrpC